MADPQSERAPSQTRLEALVGDHFDFIWRLLRRLGLCADDADDAAQEVFMVAIQKLDQMADRRERAFLYGTALRVAANARRAMARQRGRVAGDADEVRAAGAEPDELAEQHRARALLDRLLAQLPPELHRVIVLAEIEQLEVAEIAELERIPVGTAASRLRRARSLFNDLVRMAAGESPSGDSAG